MTTIDHQQTASWGSSHAADAFRARQAALIRSGDYWGAVALDVADVQAKFGNKYNEGIRQMLGYIDAAIVPNHPHFFRNHSGRPTV